MAVKRILGIDFGTSSSIIKVKTYKDGEALGAKEHVEFIRFDGAAYCPTLIYKAEDGSLFFGHKAENAAVRGVLIQNFKMDLVSGDNAKKTAAREYTQLFFNNLYQAYDESKSLFPPCDEEVTYVSYPAKWPEAERGIMVETAKKAGFINAVGIDEPSAAVHAVMVSANDKLICDDKDEINILLIDMGAGTTDLVLCKYSPYADIENGEKQIEILSSYPKADSALLLGGREVDYVLCEYVKKYLLECGLPNPKNFNEKYINDCRVWKENNVSPILNDSGTVLYVGFVDALLTMMDVDKDFPPLTRANFDEMLFEYISQLPQLVNGCLQEAGFRPDDVDYAVLTGGHSQWYFVEGVVSGSITKFGEVKLPNVIEDKSRIIRLPWPQETVALGMVFQDITVAKRSRPPVNVVKVLQIISEKYKKTRGRDIFIDIMADPIAAKRLRTEAGNAVKTLETQNSATISLTFVDSVTGATERLSEVITKAEVENGSPHTALITSLKTAATTKAEIENGPPAPRQDAPAAETKFCGGCGVKINASSAFCPHCGFSKTGIAQAAASAPQAPGDLFKTVSANCMKGMRQVAGKLSVYSNKLEFKADTLQPLPYFTVPGDRQDIRMSDIAQAARCKILGFNTGVRITLKNGESHLYSINAVRILGGVDPQEIVDFINAQI